LNCIICNGLIYKILQFVSLLGGKSGEFSGLKTAAQKSGKPMWYRQKSASRIPYPRACTVKPA
jgi:hypothetical protein